MECHGPGIQPVGVVNDKPTNFTIDVRKAGQAPLEVAIKDAFGRDVPVKLEDKRDGTIQAYYKPTSGSQHVVMVISADTLPATSSCIAKEANPSLPCIACRPHDCTIVRAYL